MSYSEKTLTEEIGRLVEERYSRKERISANDATLIIISRHLPNYEHGADFACYCVWAQTRKLVGKYLTKQFKDDTGSIKQMRFPGFDHLQVAYLIEGEDDGYIVPLEQTTAAELDQIADRLEKEGKAKLKHGQEVRKYRTARYGRPRQAA